MTTREQWLEQAVTLLQATIIGTHGTMPQGKRWQVSCGWPSSRALSSRNRRMGECWPAEACTDQVTHHIFISPASEDPVRVLGDLLHELIHAYTPGHGHRGAFKQLAKAVGLTGKMTVTYPSDELNVRLGEIAEQLGEYPHRSLTGSSTRKVQGTRMIKCVAIKCCGYVCRTTRVWIDDVGLPKCAHGSPMVETI